MVTASPVVKCFACRHPLPPGQWRCTNSKCRTWNFASSAVPIEDSTILASDVNLDGGELERIETGIVDKVFGGGHYDGEGNYIDGGGIARTSVSLLAGCEGAGKTTLCLMIANAVLESIPGKEALYIANEQSERELTATIRRLQLENQNRIRIVKAMGGVSHDVGALLLTYQPCITFLDSVTKWTGDDLAQQVLIAQRLKDYSVSLNQPTIIINQITKSGDHAGLQQLKHAVDLTAMFDLVLEEDEQATPETPRVLTIRKNRNGPAPVEMYFVMTERGLVEIPEEEVFDK